MRSFVVIGVGIVVAALLGGAVYLAQTTDEEPAPPIERTIVRHVGAEPAESYLAASKIPASPPQANYSTGFAESKARQSADRESLHGPGEAEFVNLVRSLRLSTDDSDALLDILAGENARRHEWLAANRRSFISRDEANALRSESNPLARTLLGDVKFQQYDDYRNHPEERQQIDRFNEQLVRNESRTLSQAQDDQLFAVMKEEATRTQAPSLSSFGSHLEYEAALKKWRAENMTRYRERAASVLTSDQLAVLQGGGR